MYQTSRANQTVSQGYEVYMIPATDNKTEAVYSRLFGYILPPHCCFVKVFQTQRRQKFFLQRKKACVTIPSTPTQTQLSIFDFKEL